MAKENFDFSKVDVPKEISYLKPGAYLLGVEKVEFEKPEGKTPYLNITFGGKAGVVKQKFYLTPKAFTNLQYLHQGMFGKPLTKSFESLEQIYAYFEKALTTKRIEKMVIVGGQVNDEGRVYAELPYGRFFGKEGVAYVEGEYPEGSDRWKDLVRKAQKQGAAPELSTGSAILPGGDIDASQVDSEMPW